MKKTSPRVQKRLQLRTVTLKKLSHEQLEKVAGGWTETDTAAGLWADKRWVGVAAPCTTH